MPRAPHSMALLAGRPRAKRSVFSTRMAFCRSTPFSRPMSTRETLGTGARCGGDGMPDESIGRVRSTRAGGGGASRSSASAMRVSSAIDVIHAGGAFTDSLTKGGRKLWSAPASSQGPAPYP